MSPLAWLTRRVALLAPLLLLIAAPALAQAPQASAADADAEAPVEEALEGCDELCQRELFELDPEQRARQRAARSEQANILARDEPLADDLGGLREQGFVFEDASGGAARRADSTSLVLTLLAGPFVHGIGHYSMGEQRAAWTLFSASLLGAGLMLVGSQGPRLDGAPAASWAASRMMMYSGAGLFVGSWVLDVIGTLQARNNLSFLNTMLLKGVWVGARYGFVDTPSLPLQHVLQADATLDAGRGWLQLSTLQDVSLKTSSYDASLGVRLWQSSQAPQTHAYVRGAGAWFDVRERGRFQRADALVVAGGAIDLRALSRPLRHVVVGGELGFMRQWYRLIAPHPYSRLDSAQPPSQWSYTLDSLPFALWTHLNLSELVHMRLSYTRRDGQLLHDLDRQLAVPGIALIYQVADNLDLELKGEYGAGLGLWAGVRFRLGAAQARGEVIAP